METIILFEYAKPLVVVMAVLFLFNIFLFISARAHWVIRFIGVPLILAVSVYSYVYMDKVLGYPYPGEIPKGAFYLGHNLQTTGDKLYFVVWAYPPGESKSRLYLIPFTSSQKKEFRKGRIKQKQTGARMGIRRKVEEESQDQEGQIEQGDGNLSKDYELYEIKEVNYPPKTVEE